MAGIRAPTLACALLLAHAGCSEPRTPDGELPARIAPLVHHVRQARARADSIDRWADAMPAAERTLDGVPVAMTGEGLWSDFQVLDGPGGVPWRTTETLGSESGDWTVTVVHWFGADGYTVLADVHAIALNSGCVPTIVGIRRIVFDAVGRPLHEERNVTDDEGRTVELAGCYFDYLDGPEPYPSYEALRRARTGG